MKKICLLLLLIGTVLFAQAQNLPHILTPVEEQQLPQYNALRNGYNSINTGITTPPSSPVRTIGEWEELQGFTISWTSYKTMLREIVRNAKTETRVYVLVPNATTRDTAISYLAAGGVDTVNVTFVIRNFDSVWSRDYGMWSAYTNDVDSLLSIDWIYNRPRPKDDTAHYALAALLGTPLYKTSTPPWDLVNTGGNFMTDGFGTAFASNLILNDNLPAAGFGVSHTAAQIDTIMRHFMGINRYIKMSTLPYDNIHHIDMHMKLLNEETLLVGQYPTGVADGPQIEANIQYILNNYQSVYGTPYKIIRIPMPPDNGTYPNNGGNYFTYTNSSFINKTIIVPVYGLPQDSTALNIYRAALPGYKVVGINSNASITALGALHCITKEIGTADPLLISHQPLSDTYDQVNPYTINALMKHRSGIATAQLYYTTDTTQPYLAVPMSAIGGQNDWFTAQIPAQVAGTEVFYYVQAIANSGKQQVRPMPAPQGYWHFHVLAPAAIDEHTITKFEMLPAFPNPSKGITCIPAFFENTTYVTVTLEDVTGKIIMKIFDGNSKQGQHQFFIDTQDIASGIYAIRMQSKNFNAVQKLMVR